MSRESYAAYDIVEVPQGSTATVFERTLVFNGSALDLSSASGDLLYNAKLRDGTAVITDGVATWSDDGSDGKIRFTLTAALVAANAVHIVSFEVQGYNSGNLVSRPLILRSVPTGRGA